MNKLLALAAALAAMAPASAALAQAWPAKPVRLVVGYPAGGAVDVLARTVSPKLAEALGQPVIIDNRPGAAGNIGADLVAKASPDGYTLLHAPVGFAIGLFLYRKLPFDPLDFTGVTQLVGTTAVMVVNPKVPAASLKDLIALARSKPGALNYASGGIGSGQHLSMELVKLSAGLDIVHVPYKGDAPMNTALVGGETEMAIVPITTVLPLISSGKLRAIGVTGSRRAPVLPDVPTLAEGGLQGYEFTSWQGLFAPAKTPRDVVTQVQRAAAAALSAPEVRERIVASGADIVATTPEQWDTKYRAELAKFDRTVKAAKIPPQD